MNSALHLMNCTISRRCLVEADVSTSCHCRHSVNEGRLTGPQTALWFIFSRWFQCLLFNHEQLKDLKRIRCVCVCVCHAHAQFAINLHSGFRQCNQITSKDRSLQDCSPHHQHHQLTSQWPPVHVHVCFHVSLDMKSGDEHNCITWQDVCSEWESFQQQHRVSACFHVFSERPAA